MTHVRRLAPGTIGVAGCLVLAFALPSVASADLTGETVTVTPNGTTVDGGSPAVSTSAILTSGVTYTSTVSGTYSPWTLALWTEYPNAWKACGQPEDTPEFPTRGVSNGPTGNDAAFQFGGVERGGCGSTPYPRRGAGLQVSTGGAFVAPAFAGAPAAPTADHVYRFSVVGTGSPLRLRIKDVETRDNYGDLKVAITTTGGGNAPTTFPPVPAGTGRAPLPLVTEAPTGVLSSGGVRCLSNRTLTVHLAGKRLRRVFARIAGPTSTKVDRRLLVERAATQFRVPVDLKGLPRARYTVTIDLVRKTGQKQQILRRYRTCVPRAAR